MEHLFNIHVIVIADNGMKAVLVGHRTKLEVCWIRRIS